MIDMWVEKNPNPNLESDSARESLSRFIENSLDNTYTWKPDINYSSKKNKKFEYVNKKLICDENKFSHELDVIKNIFKIKKEENDSLFQNFISKFNIKNKDDIKYIFGYVYSDIGFKETIMKMLK